MNRELSCAQRLEIKHRMTFFFLVPAWLLGVVVHELGHAIAAIAVGSRVKEISIGRGAPIATFSIARCRFHLRRNFLAGGSCTLIARRERFFRMRRFVVLIAGVAAQVVAFFFIRSIIDSRSLIEASFTMAFALVTFHSVLSNLWPRVQQGLRTDGRQILDLFSVSDEQIRWMVSEADASDFLVDAVDLNRTGEAGDSLAVISSYVEQHPENVSGHLVHAHAFIEQARYPEALDAAFRSMNMIDGDHAVPPRFQYTAENLVAYVLSLIGDPQQLTEAHRLAARAHRELDLHATAGTLGSILVQIGEVEEGRELLLRSRAGVESSLDLFETERFVMLGELAELDLAAARETFSRAMSIDDIPIHRLADAAFFLGAAEAVVWLDVFADGRAPDIAAVADNARHIGFALSTWLAADDANRWDLFERWGGDRSSIGLSSLEALERLTRLLTDEVSPAAKATVNEPAPLDLGANGPTPESRAV